MNSGLRTLNPLISWIFLKNHKFGGAINKILLTLLILFAFGLVAIAQEKPGTSDTGPKDSTEELRNDELTNEENCREVCVKRDGYGLCKKTEIKCKNQ